MSSPAVPRTDLPSPPTPDRRPPAATTGSPGTAIFFPPAPPASRSRSSSSTPRPKQDVQCDRVPVQWSFESSYGLFGSHAGTAIAPSRTTPRRESGSVLGGSWFGKRKDKGKGKAAAPAASRTKSVDAQARAPRPGSSESPQPSTTTPPPSPGHKPRSDPRASMPAPPRPERSPFRPPSALSTPSPPTPSSTPDSLPPSLPPMDFSSDSPIDTPQHVPSAPLPSIPASNAPTPRTSRSPSPVPGPSSQSRPSSHPPPSFKPTAAHRPGSSAGFKPPSSARPQPPQPSKLEKQRDPGNQRRRPATSSGVPGAHDPTLFLGASLGVYGAGTPFFITAAKGSKVSLAPSVSPSKAPSVPDTRAGAAIRRRKELRERGFVVKGGKRHHPMAKEVAPYPRHYEHKVLDHDVWENSFARQLANSLTFHTFTTPPAKVLDLGCGTGTWILECAQEWKETQFVGLDLVPIQINIARLGPADIAKRVRWVLGNFLERLPFEDGEFDFVHVKRVARGVPEDKWDTLFEEITRVLKKDGAFEMIEEDLFFPGSVTAAEEDEGEEEERPTQMPPTPPPTTPSPNSHDPPRERKMLRNDKALRRSNSDRSSTPASIQRYSPSFLSDARSRSSLDAPDGASGPTPPPRPANPTPTHAEAPPRMSLDSWHARARTVTGVFSAQPSAAASPVDEVEDEGLFHAPPDRIADPRDHSVLERAYVEMHAARFINLTPLSVLNLSLGSYFRDVRSHMPIQLAFPPPPRLDKAGSPAKSKESAGPASPPREPLSEIRHANRATPPREPGKQRHYVTLDTLRALGSGASRHTHNRLPNQNWRFDIQSLNMHLSLRVTEVLGCAEEMWEFIKECRLASGARRSEALAALAAVTREEWEDCLARFEMDMHDKIGMGPAMNERLSWSVRETPRTPERKAFDEAVEKWEKHQAQKTGKRAGGGGKRVLEQGRPLSRTLRAFVAWKGQ